MNPYIGHETQIRSVEEHRLIGGKGDGMRLYEVNNGRGLMLTITPDRAGDIMRLRYKGINLSYMSPCGYVAPAYFDAEQWLRSFTAGFLTTCGLENVGSPNEDAGEVLTLHGTLANIPSERAYWTEEEGRFVICTVTKDEVMFGRKYQFIRKVTVSTEENEFEIHDTIINTNDKEQPMEILYHMNMGYPLLDEDSVIHIPSVQVVGRDDHATEDLANWMKMQKPTSGYQEECFFHTFANEKGMASIYQPKLGIGLEMHFDTEELDAFVEWKMMGARDYVLGLECGNCYPDGRDVMRENGMLKFLQPGEKKIYKVKINANEA